jgi:hypothetical protein
MLHTEVILVEPTTYTKYYKVKIVFDASSADWSVIFDQRLNDHEIVRAAKEELCSRLTIDYESITDSGYIVTGGIQTCDEPCSHITTEYRVGLVYDSKTYIYDAVKTENLIDRENMVYETKLSVTYLGYRDSVEYDEKGNLIIEIPEDDSGPVDPYGYLSQQEVEQQAQENAQDGFVPNMADEPEEILPVQ